MTNDPTLATRQPANREILQRLTQAIEAHPEQRFGQLLLNLGILRQTSELTVRDPFCEEPDQMLARMRSLP